MLQVFWEVLSRLLHRSTDRQAACGMQVEVLLRRVLEDGHQLSIEEMVTLFQCRGADLAAVTSAANALRQRLCGDTVSYAVNRCVSFCPVSVAGISVRLLNLSCSQQTPVHAWPPALTLLSL